MSYEYIAKNLSELRSEIDILAKKANTPKVTLVCVTKSGSDEELIALAKFGATDIGENRPGELNRRGALLSENGLSVALHEIGNLQRNKVKLIAPNVILIHSLDNLPLAEVIDREAKKNGRVIDVLIEVNSAEESAKGGVLPKDVSEFARQIKSLDGIRLRGIMTMGPVCEDPEDIRPYFRLTKKIFDDLNNARLFEGEPILSMGMSDSYRIAIEEGSTLVRVGRRLFIK